MYFRGKYGFLSNFHEVAIPFEYNGHSFTMPTSENAFQAMKVHASLASEEENLNWLKRVSKADAAGSKALGRQLEIDLDLWHSISQDKMEEVLLVKFAPGSELAQKLVATGDEELVEDNDHKDTLWGRYNGEGMNLLGKILMQVRDTLTL